MLKGKCHGNDTAAFRFNRPKRIIDNCNNAYRHFNASGNDGVATPSFFARYIFRLEYTYLISNIDGFIANLSSSGFF